MPLVLLLAACGGGGGGGGGPVATAPPGGGVPTLDPLGDDEKEGSSKEAGSNGDQPKARGGAVPPLDPQDNNHEDLNLPRDDDQDAPKWVKPESTSSNPPVWDVNDTPLTWKSFGGVSVAEGVRDTGLVVTTAIKHDGAGRAVAYEIVDAAMRDLFEISPDGRLMFRGAPDHDEGGPNSHDVRIRATSESVREGGFTQTTEQTVRVEVTNLPDEALQVDAITGLVVDENSTTLRGTTQLGVTSRESGAYGVEYRLVGGAAHDFVEVSPDGVISLKQAPDHEALQAISFAVEARYLGEGQGEGAGWQGRRDITINVTDVVDEQLSLARDTEFQPGKEVTITDHKVKLDSGPSPEGVASGTVVYRIVVPTPDVAGNHIYLYLDGAGAERFTINELGELRLVDADVPEKMPSYDVTIYAREVTEEPQAHNQSPHPAKAGAVKDAAHKVVVREVFSATLGEPSPPVRLEPELDAPVSSEETEDNTSLAIANIGKLRVTENTTLLVGNSQLSLKPQGGGGSANSDTDAPDRDAPDRDAPDRDAPDRDAPDRDAPDRDAPDAPGKPAARIEYRLAGGATHEFVEVTRDGVISLKQPPNYEKTPAISFAVEVRSVRAGQGDDVGWQGRQGFTINVTNVNEKPTGFALETVTSSLDEGPATTARTALARLSVTDPDRTDAFRRHEFSLSGLDEALFEIEGGILYLKAGVVLDHEAAASHTVALSLDGTDATQDFTLDIEDVNEAPRVSVAGSQTLTLYEDSGVAADTGYRFGVTDPDDGDVVALSVNDDRFEIVNGRLLVKAGQSFDFEDEPGIELVITGTDRGGLTHQQDVTVNVEAQPHLSVTASVPANTARLSLPKEHGPGPLLDPLTISNRYRGGNDETGQERKGHVDVVSHNIGNHLILKMRFGDGKEEVVARLVRDAAQSDFRLDDTGDYPGLFTKFAGAYGHLQITDVERLPDTAEGYSQTRVTWTYTTFYERGSGAPANRLKHGETASEAVSFVVEGAVAESERNLRGDNEVSFTLRGGVDRPVLLLGARPDSRAPSDLAEEDRPVPVVEFPLAQRTPEDARNWHWWDMANIVEYAPRPYRIEENTVDADNGLVWRFVPIDEDGDYFIEAGNDDGDGDGDSGRDYGDISAFIARYVRFIVSGKMVEAHPHLEVVQASDATGAPRFITIPDSADRMPVLELRLKAGVDVPSLIRVKLVVLGTGSGVGMANTNQAHAHFEITVTDANDTPPVFTSDETADPVPEDVAHGSDATTRGDGKVVYTASARPDVAGHSVTYDLKQNAGDDSAMFGIDAVSGDVWFTAAPDHETRPSYSFTVIASVGDQSHQQSVTINVTNVNDTPLSWAALGNVSVAEGVRDTGLMVTTAIKHDGAGRAVAYEIVDAAMRDLFEISPDGRLMFRGAPDHDEGGPNSHDVRIRATSAPVREGGFTQTAEQTVRVEVTNLPDEALQINAITGLVVDENSTGLRGTTQLGVTSRESGAYGVEYRLFGGAAHDFVEVSPDGVISLKQAPDHEMMRSITFAVEARYLGEGQGEGAGWQGRRDITINVTNTNDTPTLIGGGATRRMLVEENTGSVIYRPDLTHDRAVTSAIWELSGEDADLFTVDQRTGAIRFKQAPDYETPRDRGQDNRYDVTLSVTTSDSGGRQQTASQDVEINVTDISVVMEGGSERYLTVKENHAGTFTTIRFLVDESDFDRMTFTLDGKMKSLFNIDHACDAGNCRSGLISLSFKRPPNFETRHLDFGENLRPEDAVGALHTVDVVVTAIWEDGHRGSIRKSTTKSIWISLQNQPEAPEVRLERDPGFYILTTERSQIRDTGYRVSAIDDEGDEFTLSVSDRGRFRIRNDNEIWIRKKNAFTLAEVGELALQLKAKETGPDGKKTVLPFTIPVKQWLDNIDDMFRIVGDAKLDIRENLPTETAAYAPTVAWGAGYKSSMPVIWSLHGADHGLLRIDPSTGVVRFTGSPDFESGKTVYEFTIKAVAVGGQLVNQKNVTINIQDVDEAPSEMLVIDVLDDNELTPEELGQSANRKLAKIRFKDVDSQAGNTVEIDLESRELFEIRQATHADGSIKEGVHRLWLKNGVTLEEGTYSITITAVIKGVRREDMQETFTLTVARSNELPGDDDTQPGVEPSNDNNQQSTEVTTFDALAEFDLVPRQAEEILSADIL